MSVNRFSLGFGAIAFAFALAVPATAEYRLPKDARLYQGQQIVAPGCYYHLAMQWDGNLVSYNGGGAVVWKTDTNSGEWLTVQGSDQNTVLYDAAFGAPWNTGACGG